MTNKKKYTIYLDMDSVIVDFVSMALIKMNLPSNLKTKLAKKALKKINKNQFETQDLIFDTAPKETKNYLLSLVKNSIYLWANLPWMNDGKELYRFLIKNHKQMNFNIKILTSPIDKECEIGKLLWIMNNITNKFSKEYKFNFLLNDVIFEKDKWIYAHPNSILIDDSQKNIEKFIEHQGIGILHINSNQTIKELKSILNFK